MTGATAWILSRKYTADSIIGLGAIKGASCTIKSIVPYTAPSGQTGNTITFEWTANDGVTKQTQSMNVLDGVTITDITLDANDHLIFSLSDGTTVDSGKGIYVPYARSTKTVTPDKPAKVTSVVDPITRQVAFDFEIPSGGGSGSDIQVTVMPEASVDELGNVYQYIGEETELYTHNYFYECVPDGLGGYKWINVIVQDEGEQVIPVFTPEEWEAMTPEQKDQYDKVVVLDGGGSGGGGGTIRDVTANLTVGAITSGTTIPTGTELTEFLERLLITEIAPTTSFSASGSGVKEKGTTVTPTLTLTITSKGTGTPTSIEFYNGSTLLDTQSYVDGTNTYTFNMSAISDTTTVKGILRYNKSGGATASVEKTATYTFVYASYYGVVSTAPATEADVKAMTKNVKNTKAYTTTFNLTNQRSCYAYPASFGDLTSIKDANNFEYLSSYTKTTLTVDTATYNIYTLTDPVTATGFKQIFA